MKKESKKKLKKALIWSGVVIVAIGGGYLAIKTGKLSQIGDFVRRTIPKSALKEIGLKSVKLTQEQMKKNGAAFKKCFDSVLEKLEEENAFEGSWAAICAEAAIR